MRALLTLIVGVLLSLTVTASFAAGDRRVALVIGNSAYRKFPALPNPKNDAEDVSAALKRIGFTVMGGPDLTRQEMRDSLRQFARAAQDAEAALVFYAGHGLQYRGRNYLVPIDAKLEDEFDLDYETVRVDDVVEELNRADGPRILVLDACRNLPLQTKAKDAFSSTGLAKLSGRGLIVAYATQANQVAYDGKGRNSIFTGAFIKSVEEPGLDVTQVFQRVSINVDKTTQGRQTPELSLSFPGQFYFNKGETEREAWPRARASADPEQLRDFIARFPNSFLVDDAKDLIRRLERSRQEGPAQVARADTAAPAEPPRQVAPPPAARRPDEAPEGARSKDEVDRAAWLRLQEEQKRRAEQRQQAEREQIANDATERQRLAQEEERRRIETRRAELEKLVEEAKGKKLAEERAAAEARERAATETRERQRLAAEAKQEEERRRAEARRLEQERVAEAARQKKLAEDQAAAEARERQRVALEAKQEEDRRRAEARRAEQERVAEAARQRKLAEDQAAADAKERQRLAFEAKQEDDRRRADAARAEQERAADEMRQRILADERSAADAKERARLALESRQEEDRRRAEALRAEADRVADANRQRLLATAPPSPAQTGSSGQVAGGDDAAWARLEEEQRRRRADAAPGPVLAAAGAPPGSPDQSVQATLAIVKSRETAASSALAPGGAATSAPVRLALNDSMAPVQSVPAPVSGFPESAIEQEKLVREIQTELGRIGCYDDDVDGKWDAEAREAIRRFGRQAKLAAVPNEPSRALLEDLKTRPAHFCPLQCGTGERVSGDRCVAVARPEPKPVIEKKQPAKPKAVVQERRAPEPRPVAQAPRPRPAAAPPQAPVAQAAAPKPARALMGVGF